MPLQKHVVAIILVFQLLSCTTQHTPTGDYLSTEKPWAYWWWMGSSVTKEGISANLKSYHEAGIGGMHIIPIYGEKEDESNFIDFLSPQWMDMLVFTLSEAEKLGMGIDMTMGTGWPFGGPNVTKEHAAKTFRLEEFAIHEINKIQELISSKQDAVLIALAGVKKNGDHQNITEIIQPNGKIPLNHEETYSKLISLVMHPTGQKVKRAAPGGEGLVLDYFNKAAMDTYFQPFKKAFDHTTFPSSKVRSFYNDSYEVYGANFTNDFLEKFKTLRGYSLVSHLPTLSDTSRSEIRDRIVSDFCETISDLLLTEFTENWVQKSHAMGMMTRNQAHGSPANILDLYGAVDIPETESFGVSPFTIPGLRQDPDFEEERFGRPNPLAMKFASSPAHLLDKKLVSSETATWLGDHFKVALSQIKPQIDELFTAGINHVFYHGITYSPPDKSFPGRLFYASTNFGPQAHFWQELPALNQYITRCQSALQNSEPDNDVLVYFPVHDLYTSQSTDQVIRLLTAHHTREWLEETPFGEVVTDLWEHGFGFDYISDRMLDRAAAFDSQIRFEGGIYQAIVIPQCNYFPEKTMHKLLQLAGSGIKIIFCEALPISVNGLNDLKNRQAQFLQLKEEIRPQVAVTKDAITELIDIGVRNEEMALAGLSFIRKKEENETIYFVANLADRFYNGTLRLATKANNIEIFDPLTGKRGLAKSRSHGDKTEILLHLSPGQSCLLHCYDGKAATEDWIYFEEQKEGSFTISTDWTLTPMEGSPELPPPAELKELQSWTELGGDYEVFSGKVSYTSDFILEDQFLGKPYRIDLGDVRETASLRVNGKDLGLLWSVPYSATIPADLLKKENTIAIEVTNLSYNRVIDLDRKGIPWKNFHDINLVNIKYEPFDASSELPMPSGLLGEIKFVPLLEKK